MNSENQIWAPNLELVTELYFTGKSKAGSAVGGYIDETRFNAASSQTMFNLHFLSIILNNNNSNNGRHIPMTVNDLKKKACIRFLFSTLCCRLIFILF